MEIGTLERPQAIRSVPILDIFTSVPMWALISAQIGHDWCFYIMVGSIQKYLNEVIRINIEITGYYSSIPFLVMWVCSICFGIIADVMLRKEVMSITNLRKLMTGIAAFGPAMFVVGASYAECKVWLVVLCLTINMGMMGGYYAGMKLSKFCDFKYFFY